MNVRYVHNLSYTIMTVAIAIRIARPIPETLRTFGSRAAARRADYAGVRVSERS
ncbi:hypothetical protein WN48_01729 [Eufriesea mexicana]|uniref:Uncharacterized protein n=1 Tax=Eufriesea mexicana TaxID=516756 RepID=A0A310SGE1_9HYME|nr:hypothetical protein WN48_01729 [Eufriesea mexicana]